MQFFSHFYHQRNPNSDGETVSSSVCLKPLSIQKISAFRNFKSIYHCHTRFQLKLEFKF